jgi:uncharacterized membrane protein
LPAALFRGRRVDFCEKKVIWVGQIYYSSRRGCLVQTLDVHTIILFVLRWIHFCAGIAWIGLLYFFNLVNGPFAATMDGETKKKVVPQLMPRALFWFRWAAMTTFIDGLLMIWWKLFVASDAGFAGTGGLFTSTWGLWITFGGLLGTIMWFNVWFVIWPAQKKIITWTKEGKPPPEMPATAKRALLFSRINMYLSLPMLFAMGAASHLPVIDIWTLILVLLVGFGLVYLFIKGSQRVKGF